MRGNHPFSEGPGGAFGPGDPPDFPPPGFWLGGHGHRGRGFGGRHGGRRRRGDVRLALLMLLAVEAPSNGYQLMQGLEQRSGGRWRPSPGSVYPALAQLEDEGLIRPVQSDGGSGHSYELTDAGRAHLAQRGEQRPPWEPPPGDEAQLGPRMRDGVIGVARAAWHVAQDCTPEQIEEAIGLLEETRRRLYALLAGGERPEAGASEPPAGA